MRQRRPPATVDEYRDRARRALPRAVFDFVDGGAEEELTLTRNRDALRAIMFRPTVATGITSYETTASVLGESLALPVLLAPTGLAALVHRDGEPAGVRAAEAHGTRAVLSAGSSYSMEDIAAAANVPHWFQVYPWRSADFVNVLLDRARSAGFSTLCITLDVPAAGHRERDTRNGFTIPLVVDHRNLLDVARHPRWALTTLRHRRFDMANLIDQSTGGGHRPLSTLTRFAGLNEPWFTWDDVARIRERWPGPCAVKGVLTAADAARAVEAGCDAVIVSNHGGRQLDGAPAAIEALPEVVGAVGGGATVLVDGGVRRGADVVKALALGATACLVGRPWLYGLAAGGEGGVSHVLTILHDEITRTLALVGRPSTAALDRSVLWDG